MCGLAGFLDPLAQITDREDVLRRMADSLAHRGPDDAGYWIDAECGIGLGHRRLSVLDLSEAGHQPMFSSSGRWAIAYNGEIYNHLEFRAELEKQGVGFRGHSDTETLVNAIAVLGLEQALRASNGMFALAAWDRQERRLWLARDRAGKKPLYYAAYRGGWVFGSELRALYALPRFTPSIDREALTLYLRHNHVPAPRTIFSGVYKLPAGTMLALDPAEAAVVEPPVPEAYWSAAGAARQAQARPFAGSLDDAVSRLDTIMRDATRLRMLSDVPLGVFLSGGIDSSLVTACMQAESIRPVQSFSIGFESAQFDEARFAGSVASHLGTDHSELYVTERELFDTVPQLPEIYDEPFADSSQIPSFLVSKMARRDVTVALAGDGGDELFGGYERYVFGAERWRRMRVVPRWLRIAVNGLVKQVPTAALNSVMAMLASRHGERQRDLGARIKLRLQAATAASGEMLHRDLVSDCRDPQRLVIDGHEPEYLLSPANAAAGIHGLPQRMMLLDYLGWLPDDLLAKMDRASMAVSLEVRAPLLDYRLFEFAWTLPSNFCFDEQGSGKLILRRLLGRYLPPELFDRPKQGFCVPVSDWLRGPLRDWANELLEPARLEQEGYFNAGLVRQRWCAHQARQQDWGDLLWNLLMFQAWHERWHADVVS